MRPLLCAAAALLACAVTMSAQVRYRPTENGPWRPWHLTAIASARQERGVTPVELRAWDTRLQELAAILKRAPAVAQPVGFAGEVWGNLQGYTATAPGEPRGASIPLAGYVTFGAFPLIEFMRNGRLMNEDLKGGETQLLMFAINEIGRGVFSAGQPAEWKGDVEGFLEPRSGPPHKGLPRVADLFVLKRHDKPLWIPVSLGEALKPFIAGVRATYENRRDIYAKEVAEFQAWQTPAARAARRADWDKAAKVVPDGQAFLANMEKTDRELEAFNRTRLAPGGPEDRSVQEAERDLRAAEAAAAAFSPAQQAGPSCYIEEYSDKPATRFRPLAGGPATCRPIVKPNWDYFDRALPRSTPQVLMVTAFTRCLTPESMRDTARGGCVVNRQLVDTLDWAAVRAWLAQ